MDSRYSNPDAHPKGPWKSTPLYAKRQGSEAELSFNYTFMNGVEWSTPHGTSPRFPAHKLKSMDENNEIWFGTKGDAAPSRKTFLSELKANGTPAPTVWLHSEAGNTHQARDEIKEINLEVNFATTKPTRLIKRILQIASDKNSLILDSFAGSGTTGHAVLDMNKQDGGNRKFILVEMEPEICADVTAERLRRVIGGYEKKNGDKTEHVEGLGGGFRYCTLGTPLFDEFGDVAQAVTFPDLAAHIFFSETGSPIQAPAKVGQSLLGTWQGRAVYLLFSPADIGAARAANGNVLTPDMLDALALPEGFEGVRVVYGEGCTISAERLKAEKIIFKQIPYQVEGA